MVSQKKMVLDYIRGFGSITPLDAFKDEAVDKLDDSERGDNGYGSTGE